LEKTPGAIPRERVEQVRGGGDAVGVEQGVEKLDRVGAFRATAVQVALGRLRQWLTRLDRERLLRIR
jgi:hypothetical protein